MKPAARLPRAARAILRGDRRALAQTISAVEDGDPAAAPIVAALYPRTGRARIVGFTGPMGVGKSTLLNRLIAHLRGLGKHVGIVAVDPTSPFSGGSVLGDRIRIERAPDDASTFFRSMASRGHSGGLAAATRSIARLLEASGRDTILVETVGSGQVDTDLRDVASTSVVVVVPHLGDEVQTLKAGLLEIADVFCVNKADLPGADEARRDLLELGALDRARSGWHVPVVATSASQGTGIEELWAAVDRHEEFLDRLGGRRELDRRRLLSEIVDAVRDQVGENVRKELGEDPGLSQLLDRVVDREVDPGSAARVLYRRIRRRR